MQVQQEKNAYLGAVLIQVPFALGSLMHPVALIPANPFLVVVFGFRQYLEPSPRIMCRFDSGRSDQSSP